MLQRPGIMYAARFVFLALLYKLALSGCEPLRPTQADSLDFPPESLMDYIKHRGGVHINLSELKKVPVMKHDDTELSDLPESFDPRDKWPNCPTLNEIRDQGRCGACWAFGAVETMTDRVCTYFNGTKNFHFSAEDILTCNAYDSGCNGGNGLLAWNEWVTKGLVSGGNYNSHEGCKPYSVPTCANHLKNCTNYQPTPQCVRSCQDGYNKQYNEDKKRGNKFYMVLGEKDIMAELYKNGPVEASFMVYDDLANYTGGVYQHGKGANITSGHSVKMLGWGVENGIKYWLLANSWGTDFGENGFFKIIRGVNECYIESMIMTGEPLMEDY